MPIEIKITNAADLSEVRQLRNTLNIMLGDGVETLVCPDMEPEGTPQFKVADKAVLAVAPGKPSPHGGAHLDKPALAAPAAPLPPAPSTTAAPAPPAGPELDSLSLPWDARIHSSGKTTRVKCGTWTPKRGVSLQLKAQVEAELLCQPLPPETGAAPAPPPATAVAPVDFPALMAMGEAKGLTFVQMNEIAAAHGLASITMAATRPEICAKIAINLGTL